MTNCTEPPDDEGTASTDPVLIAAQALAKHPYSLLSLADREKFHTGFVAHGIRRFGLAFAKAFFEGLNIEEVMCVDAVVEESSIDLVIRTRASWDKPWQDHALMEMKFKAGMREKQAKKLAKRVDPESVAKLYVVGIYEPAVDQRLLGSKCVFVDLVAAGVGSVAAVESRLTEEDPERVLFCLWRAYLKSMGILREHFNAVNPPYVPGLRDAMDRAKIRSIFEGERMRRVVLEVEEEVRKSPIDGLEPTHYDNTRGNPLVDFKFGKVKGNAYGLQWQADSLKFFIEAGGADRGARNERLLSLANDLHGAFNGDLTDGITPFKNLKPGRDGDFRSVCMATWSPLENNKNRAQLIVQLLRRMQGYRAGVEALCQLPVARNAIQD